MSRDFKHLIKRKENLLQQITQLKDILWGNLLERYTTCSRPNCRCHRGELHGPRYYLTMTKGGKQKQRYIKVAHVDKAKKGAEQKKELEAILDEITEINLILMEKDEEETKNETKG